MEPLIAVRISMQLAMEAFLLTLGVIYSSAWTLSFYPQVILNFRRKSVTGFSGDYTVVNPIGFFALTLWNFGLYYNHSLQDQYRLRHRGNPAQIAGADVFFAGHAFLLSSIVLVQAIRYGFQPVAKPTWIFVATVFTAALLGGVLVQTHAWGLEWLDWFIVAGWVKIYVSVAKYVPQIYLQHKLRSTAGFATSALVLDLIGSLLSLLQLTISSLRIGDPSLIWGNPAKFGLGLLTLLFDILMICQSVWYRGRQPEDKVDETTPLLDEQV